MGGGALNLKIHPQGLLSISFMFQQLAASVGKFSKKCFAFSNSIIISFKLQTSYHIYFKFPSMGSPSWASLPCDNPVCRIWQNLTRSCACRFNHVHHVQYDLLYQNSGGSRGGAQYPPLFLDYKLRLKGPKNFFFGDQPFPHPNPPSPHYIKVWIQHCRIQVYANREAKY